ncbi:MAG: hypothetical protein IT342_17980 [Candidatus Melainabacteria bacterium]|nr:hypothetical protein [Candidatus Melainabacteria bacterium]
MLSRKSKVTILLLAAIGFISAGVSYAGCCGGGNDDNQFSSGLQSQLVLTSLIQQAQGTPQNVSAVPFIGR